MKINTKRGFTLIELLVVIAIIGILSSVVLVSLNSARNKGKDARTQTELAQLRTQLETDYDGSSYLMKCGDSVAFCGAITSTDGTGLGLASAGGYGTLITDIFKQNTEGVQVTLASVSTSVASPATGYALYAWLPSSPATTKVYSCIASDGTTKNNSSGPPTTVNAANAVTCN